MMSRLALATTVAAIVLGTTAGASAQTYEVTKLVPGSAFHGVHGLGIDKSGRLFAGSVAGAALYEVDRNNGTAKIAVPSPEGMSDDIAFAPDGTMAELSDSPLSISGSRLYIAGIDAAGRGPLAGPVVVLNSRLEHTPMSS